MVTYWRDWSNPRITNIKLTKDLNKVTVGIRVKGPAGCWGAFDNMYITKER